MFVSVPAPTAATSTPTASLDRKMFFFALIAVTALPMLLLPFYTTHVPAPLFNLMMLTWLLAGFAHVMSTVWFGVDGDYRPVIEANRARMLGSLLALPAMMAGVAIASVAASSWLYAAYTVWLAHHYNRQNFGLVAFAGVHDEAGPLPRELGWMFNLTTAAGAIRMVAMPTIYPGRLSPFGAPVFDLYGRHAAAALMIAAAVVMVRMLARHSHLRRCPMVLTFIGFGFAFYLPTLLHGPNEVAFFPYAIAHGLQYLLMMTVVSRGSKFGRMGPLLLAGLAVPLGMIVYSAPTLPLMQAYTGIVMWHFLADAKLWRLRDPMVRSVIKQRFGFLFQPANA